MTPENDAKAQQAMRIMLDHYRRGVAAERARVVAWLRERARELRERGGGRLAMSAIKMEQAADAIERGEHEEGT